MARDAGRPAGVQMSRRLYYRLYANQCMPGFAMQGPNATIAVGDVKLRHGAVSTW